MKPPKLAKNDLVAIISPSNPIAHRAQEVEAARHNFELSTSLRTVLAPNALAHHYYSAGSVQERLSDFHWALTNPEIKAIIFSVGGETAVELLSGLDYDLIRRHPKIIAGISDATTLLNPITTRTGLTTFLGLEFLDYATEEMTYETESIIANWFAGKPQQLHPNPNWKDFDDTKTSYAGWHMIKQGCAEGRIVGGNFPSFAQLLNSDFKPELDGSILVVEYYKSSKRSIYMSMQQLKLWGVFEQINGLVLGYCLGSDEPDVLGNDQSITELVLEATKGYNFPIMQVGEIGHNIENLMLPIGASAAIDTKNLEFKILESVVV